MVEQAVPKGKELVKEVARELVKEKLKDLAEEQLERVKQNLIELYNNTELIEVTATDFANNNDQIFKAEIRYKKQPVSDVTVDTAVSQSTNPDGTS